MLRKVLLTLLAVVVMGVAAILAIFFRPDLSREQLAAIYVNDKSKFIKLSNGADVHYRDEGNPNALCLADAARRFWLAAQLGRLGSLSGQ